MLGRLSDRPTTTLWVGVSRFRNRPRFGRVGDLNNQIFELFSAAGIARNGVQGVRIFIEHFACFESAYGSVVDLDLIGAFEDVAHRVTAGMPVCGTAVAGIAFGEADRKYAARDIRLSLIEHLRDALASGYRGRLRLRGRG